MASFDIFAVPIIVKTRVEAADGRQRAGGGDWQKWRRDLGRLLQNPSPGLRVTTLFDLYGLPTDFPQLAELSKQMDTGRRADLLEAAMAEEVADPRFLPYLQRHEFETLVLAAVARLEPLLLDRQDRLGCRELIRSLGDLAPEDINDGESSAPSKRLARFIPSYDPPVGRRTAGNGKSVYGPAVTQSLGLPGLREKCPRFDAWVSKLETLNR